MPRQPEPWEGRGGAARTRAGSRPCGTGRPRARRALTGLGGGVLGAALEGEAEEQLVAAAARAHKDNADGAGALAHAAAPQRAPGGQRRTRLRRKAARPARLPLPRLRRRRRFPRAAAERRGGAAGTALPGRSRSEAGPPLQRRALSAAQRRARSAAHTPSGCPTAAACSRCPPFLPAPRSAAVPEVQPSTSHLSPGLPVRPSRSRWSLLSSTLHSVSPLSLVPPIQPSTSHCSPYTLTTAQHLTFRPQHVKMEPCAPRQPAWNHQILRVGRCLNPCAPNSARHLSHPTQHSSAKSLQLNPAPHATQQHSRHQPSAPSPDWYLSCPCTVHQISLAPPVHSSTSRAHSQHTPAPPVPLAPHTSPLPQGSFPPLPTSPHTPSLFSCLAISFGHLESFSYDNSRTRSCWPAASATNCVPPAALLAHLSYCVSS